MAEVILNYELVYKVSVMECLFTVKIKSTNFSFLSIFFGKIQEL